MSEQKEVTITLQELIKLAKLYPNNFELGDQVRKLIELKQKNQHGS
jgi:hypothetical protein